MTVAFVIAAAQGKKLHICNDNRGFTHYYFQNGFFLSAFEVS